MGSSIRCLLFPVLLVLFSACGASDPSGKEGPSKELISADSIHGLFSRSLIEAGPERTLPFLDSIIQKAERTDNELVRIMALGCKGIYNTHPRFDEQKKGVEQLKRAIKLAGEEYPDLSALFTHSLGYANFWSGNKKKALKQLLKADLHMRSVGYEKVPRGAVSLYHMGKVYFDFGNYDRAEEYVRKALEHAEGKELLRLGSLNLLGNIQAEKRTYGKAQEHYSQALALAKELEDSTQIGVTGGNLGGLYLEMGKYEKARPLLRKGYELGKRFGLEYNRMSAQLKLLLLEVEEGRPERAMRSAEEARKVLNKSDGLGLEAWVEYHKGKAKLHTLLGEERKAIRHYDSLTRAKERLFRTRNASTLGDLEAQITARRHLNEIQLLKREQELQRVKRNSILGFIILVALFISYLWYRTWQRRKQERERFLAEQQAARGELDRFREQIREKNRRIESFRSRLNELSKHLEDQNGLQVQEEVMERLAETHILTEEDWSEFKRLFKKVHPNFFDKLLKEHSELTSAELRLMALMKLDLSVSEIAQMLGILPESVRKTRQRLVKKLNFEDHKTLARFIREL